MLHFYFFMFTVILTTIFLARIFFLVICSVTKKRKVVKRSSKDRVKTIIVIGSGGHTSEMMYLVASLNLQRYSPRLYLMATSDTWSEQKIHDFESKVRDNESKYEVHKIPRSRSVHQSYFTSIFSTINSTLSSIPAILRFNPDLILCNGPGTCIPVCVIAFVMRCCFISSNTIIFVESICRVKSMSLSGKILQWFADEIMVQWPELLKKCSRAQYIGRVV